MQVLPFDEWLDESVAEVLESMCFTTSEPAAAALADGAGDWVNRRLEFVGPEQGSFGIRTTLPTARMIACNLLALEDQDLSDHQAGEAIGEIANMVCGAVLGRFETTQHFNLSSPKWDETAVPEDQISRQRVSRMFSLDEGTLVAWLEIEQAK